MTGGDERTCKHKGSFYVWPCKECRRVRLGEDDPHVARPNEKVSDQGNVGTNKPNIDFYA